MPGGTGMDIFGRRFPKRTFDVGIAEQHAVTFAGAMAAEGLKPFCAIYSTFMQRGYDQVVHDVVLQVWHMRVGASAYLCVDERAHLISAFLVLPVQ